MLAPRHQHQRTVYRHHLVEKDRDVHRARLWHAVVALPGAVILMPLPDVTGEGRFGVDLVLVHVELLAEDLLDRIDHARMRAEQAERLVIEMRGKGGARRAALFAPHLRAVVIVDAHGLLRQQGYFFRAEQLGQEQPALAVEIVDLLLGQFHGGSSFWFLILPRHGRACPGHPRLRLAPREDVDARHKAGHDACYAARLGAFSLSSVIRPALIACASAELSAAFALPDRIWAAMASCSVQALWR